MKSFGELIRSETFKKLLSVAHVSIYACICYSEHESEQALFLIVVKVIALVGPAVDAWDDKDLDDALEQAGDDEEGAPEPVLELVVVDLGVQEVRRIVVPVSKEGSKQARAHQVLENAPHEIAVKEGNHEPAHAHGQEERLHDSEPAPVERDVGVVFERPVDGEHAVADDEAEDAVPADHLSVTLGSNSRADAVLNVGTSVAAVNLCVTHRKFSFKLLS